MAEQELMQDYAAEQAAAQARGMPLGSAVVSEETFPVADFADEIGEAAGNGQVGSRVLFENDRVRIWELALEPGERLPFHCHAKPYFWVCVDGARGAGREPDGAIAHFEFKAGEVDFLPLRDGERLVHDIENTGDARLRFVTVELLG